MIQIKNSATGKLIVEGDFRSISELVVDCIRKKLNLSGADLSGADLSGADLSEVNLSGADLSSAYLFGADLSGADLSRAYLFGADLSEVNLSGADLSRADLSRADLSRADLSGADLSEVDLFEADLSEVNLSRADLSEVDLSEVDLSGVDLSRADLFEADLSEVDLSRAILPPLLVRRLSIVPESGAFSGWKKCRNNVLVKVEIPEAAKRSNATGRKCRAEFVWVLEVIGATEGVSIYDHKTSYRVGEIVTCNKWEEDRWIECAGGIHFFITKSEAENYTL